MAAVYRWMAFGLALTGMVAYGVLNSPSILSAFFHVQYGQIVGVSGLFWIVGIAQLGMVLLFVPALDRLSFGAAVGLFLGYCALSGVTFSVFPALAGGGLRRLLRRRARLRRTHRLRHAEAPPHRRRPGR
jgi:FtsH-binding integral membrane protein